MRILLVEDEEDFRFLLGASLRMGGHDVVAVASGEEALGTAGAFDLALLDIRLPGIDGFEVLATLGPTVDRVVMMSAHGDADLAQRATAEGAVAFLPKPFQLSALRDLLAELAA